MIMNEMIDMNNKPIIGIKEDTVDSGAVNFQQLESYSNLKLDKTGGDLSGILDMNNNRIIGVADPTSSKDAVNKQYVDKNSGNGAEIRYFKIFDTFIDLLNTNDFYVETIASGPILDRIENDTGSLGVIPDSNKPETIYDLKRFNKTYGWDTKTDDGASFMKFRYGTLSNVSSFQVFFTIKLSSTGKTFFIINNRGLKSALTIEISNNGIGLKQGSETYGSTLLSQYKNRQIMVQFNWETGGYCNLQISDGSSSITRNTNIELDPTILNILTTNYLLKFGTSFNKPVSREDRHWLMFAEKRNGTFFL